MPGNVASEATGVGEACVWCACVEEVGGGGGEVLEFKWTEWLNAAGPDQNDRRAGVHYALIFSDIF